MPQESQRAHWPKDAAGHRMTEKVPRAELGERVAGVRERLLRDIAEFQTVSYIYVLEDGKLAGVLSLKDLFRAQPGARIEDVCRKSRLAAVHPETHQERAAYLALRENIKAVPIVAKDHTFLGVIPGDAILGILSKETHEDLLRLAGVRHPQALAQNILTTPLLEAFRHRAPWLAIGLIGGLVAARIIGAFEATLERNLLLASFIPLIVYMSDAVGTQLEACIIRDLAMDYTLPFRRYVLRQFAVVLAIALSFGGILFLASAAFYGDLRIGAVLGIALLAAVLTSVFAGLLIPYAFSRMKMDPADAAGPIATIVQDILSIVTYFAIASALL